MKAPADASEPICPASRIRLNLSGQTRTKRLEIGFSARYIAAHAHVGTCRAELQSDRTGLKEEWGLRMRRLLPSRVEVAIFATLAVLCAALVGAFAPKTYDLRFAAFAGPIFLVAAVMGLRRNPAFQVVDVEDEDAVE